MLYCLLYYKEEVCYEKTLILLILFCLLSACGAKIKEANYSYADQKDCVPVNIDLDKVEKLYSRYKQLDLSDKRKVDAVCGGLYSFEFKFSNGESESFAIIDENMLVNNDGFYSYDDPLLYQEVLACLEGK